MDTNFRSAPADDADARSLSDGAGFVTVDSHRRMVAAIHELRVDVSEQLQQVIEKFQKALDRETENQRLLCQIVAGQVPGDLKKNLTTEEAASLCGRSPYTIRSWIKKGRLSGAKKIAGTGPKGKWIIPRESLTKLLEEGPGEALSGRDTDSDSSA